MTKDITKGYYVRVLSIPKKAISRLECEKVCHQWSSVMACPNKLYSTSLGCQVLEYISRYFIWKFSSVNKISFGTMLGQIQ